MFVVVGQWKKKMRTIGEKRFAWTVESPPLVTPGVKESNGILRFLQVGFNTLVDFGFCRSVSGVRESARGVRGAALVVRESTRGPGWSCANQRAGLVNRIATFA